MPTSGETIGVPQRFENNCLSNRLGLRRLTTGAGICRATLVPAEGEGQLSSIAWTGQWGNWRIAVF
jgi:hypothetical protein